MELHFHIPPFDVSDLKLQIVICLKYSEWHTNITFLFFPPPPPPLLRNCLSTLLVNICFKEEKGMIMAQKRPHF